MDALLYPIVSVSLISIISLVGVFTLSLKEAQLDRILFPLISFSSGAILGAAFFDLLPEALDLGERSTVLTYVALGFLFSFLLERSIYWYHGHGHAHNGQVQTVRGFVYLNMLGDAIHNFLDGTIIATTFLLNPPLGIATTIAVIFHELPQEIGDFAILVFGGLSKKRALLFNFFSALSAYGGVFLAFFSLNVIEGLGGFLVAASSGAFIYLAASELLPEIRKERLLGRSMFQYLMFVSGLALLWYLGILFPT